MWFQAYHRESRRFVDSGFRLLMLTKQTNPVSCGFRAAKQSKISFTILIRICADCKKEWREFLEPEGVIKTFRSNGLSLVLRTRLRDHRGCILCYTKANQF